MSEPIRAEIVAIGTEMLLGDLIDTNSAFIAQQLKAVGVNMYFKTIVGDNLDRISGAISQSHGRSQVDRPADRPGDSVRRPDSIS